MPNHIHRVIEINNDVGTPLVGVLGDNVSKMAPTRGATTSDIIGAFKSWTTNEYIKNVKEGNLPKFDKKIGQRSYYDHIIRKEESLQKILEYIIINPQEWKKDELFVEI